MEIEARDIAIERGGGREKGREGERERERAWTEGREEKSKCLSILSGR